MTHVEERIGRMLGAAVRATTPVGGGCIANARRVDTHRGPSFVKSGSGDVAAALDAEFHGLQILADAGAPVPAVVGFEAAVDDRPALLLMEWVHPGARDAAFWRALGLALAALHAWSSSGVRRYGLDRDNYIGRLPQENGWMDDWSSFFAERRLLRQAQRARKSARWRSDWDRDFERLLACIRDELPAQPHPALLHGDLWQGNVMAASDGRAVLIDPAPYHGHAEADLAMTELFGGFAPEFYAAYREVAGRQPGYARRTRIYNLYHLINHLNHFGEGYAHDVEVSLRDLA